MSAPATALVVDDSRTIRRQVRHLLGEGGGLAIQEANDAVDALRWLGQCPDEQLPEVILLDRNMPQMSGDVCIRILKADPTWSLIPVLFLTAQGETQQLVRGLSKLGADDYLAKPFDADELLARVQVLIRIKQAEDRTRALNADLEDALEEQKRAYEELRVTKIQLAETEAAAKLTDLFERFVPKEFLHRIAPDGLEHLRFGQADHDFITILFSDIRSFIDLAETLSPQQLLDFLNAYFARMNEPIRQSKGFVDKFIGDGILALFDLPDHSDKDEAVSALHAAIAMQTGLQEWNRERADSGAPPVKMGIGIHSGHVIIGTVGSEQRMDSTVLGDAVNLASRLEGLTKFYGSSILISEATFELLPPDHAFLIRELDLVQVKGKQEPVRIYEVFDCDPEPLRAVKQRSREFLQAGLEAYRARKWKRAVACFRKCQDAEAPDAASAVLLERATEYQRTPPPRGWQRVHRFTDK
mgnify:CR=1 FL=1